MEYAAKEGMIQFYLQSVVFCWDWDIDSLLFYLPTDG